MRELERIFPDRVSVVGVHSGKFLAERVTSRIRDACCRLGVSHPVINDRQFRVWRSYAVQAWPTLVAIDPRGYVVGGHAGEFTVEALLPFVQRVLDDAERAGTLAARPDEWPADAPTIAPGALRYPEKVAVSGRRMAIADTGHHRVLIGDLDASGRAFRARHEVPFEAPQGLLFAGDTLYVADSEHHLIRAVDATSGAARTISGTGAQLRTSSDLREGALSSPWDLALADEVLYIAMAGNHQLWSLQLPVGDTPRRAHRHTGSGAEALEDGPQLQAALAQPMGLALDGRDLAFADAESSAIRLAALDPDGTVRTVVGTGLFDFGFVDGVGDEARLQHPQGVAVVRADGARRLLVADTYNDALRWVDPTSRRVTTFVRDLHEPAGLCVAGDTAYVADTNAHRVVAVKLETGEVEEVTIEA